MPIKNFLQRFQPTQLYLILVLSICYFSVQLVLSHLTHALTLLMASYHMLCNIFALAGCIVTIKHSKRRSDDACRSKQQLQVDNSTDDKIVVDLGPEAQTLAKREKRAMKLRNTFGWTRIDILTMLIVCIILASLSFSLLVEALQTLVHIDHQDTMHLPIPVLILGFVGLILNGITYFLIGGYTLHQGSFLHLTPSGTVILDRAMSNSGELTLQPDDRQLSKSRNEQQLKEELQKEGIGGMHFRPHRRQGAVEMLRDISSTLFVIVCAFIVYLAQDEEHTAKFIDPVLSIFSCVLLVSLSYPYMKESCLILLQTIPGSINMENFERTLVSKFPEIVSYHDLHIWQLSAHQYVATIHIKFQSPKLYTKIIEDVRAYFHEQGITEITIQPEFDCAQSVPSVECLVQCNTNECAEKVCCTQSRSDLREVGVSESPDKVRFQQNSVESQDGDEGSHGHSHGSSKSFVSFFKSRSSPAKSVTSVASAPAAVDMPAVQKAETPIKVETTTQQQADSRPKEATVLSSSQEATPNQSKATTNGATVEQKITVNGNTPQPGKAEDVEANN